MNCGEQPFLPHEPAYIEQHGLFNQVPYITGVTKRESASFVTEKMMSQASYWQDINNDLEQVVPVTLGLAKGSQKSKEVAQKVKSFYFGNKTISYENRELWISLQTDLLFVTGVIQTVHTHANHSASKTYNYQFVYGHSGHAMELIFVLYNGKMQGESSNSVKIARIVGGLWTSFAKTGVPSVEGVAAWKPVTSNGSYPYLEISLSPVLKYNLEKEHMDFWENIYNEYGN
ncbi:fatty acyl-CoA hydrolase precursor, medium chain-like [Bacillus rossius redtenbacheri]|uniref:fatty acyl-CoA hydrolase precursor, medium chain-like n=1 Tax=Bacillus rossius redtenbacheri TaxID=93214 RepID=UPI002FDE2CFF